MDRILEYFLWLALILLGLKNLWISVGFSQIYLPKIFPFVFEIGSVVLSFFFVLDYDYQANVTVRCPTQWQYGAFGLFIGYLGLLYYIQYIPIIGVYVIMLKIVLIQFIFFIPVLACLIIGFGISFYMLFQYHPSFNDFQTRALSQIGRFSRSNLKIYNSVYYITST